MQSKVVLVVLLIAALVVMPAMAVSQKAAEKGINGKGNADHLYLFEKDPSGDWPIIDGGAWGKLNYQSTKFVFNGHELESGLEYALIYYPDPWPGTGLKVIGEGLSDENGNVHIGGTWDLATLHDPLDLNAKSKIWLVLADDVGEGQMSGWNPTEYLFEFTPI